MGNHADNNKPNTQANSNKIGRDMRLTTEETVRVSDKRDTRAVNAITDYDDERITHDLQDEAAQAMQQRIEHQHDDVLENARVDTTPITYFDDDMVLQLVSGENEEAIIKAVDNELIVGRSDNITDYVPDIDLTPHGAYRLGLSRRHAIIYLEDNKINIKDLSSRNGTFINGVLVPGGKTRILRDGDELRFANLTMTVSFAKQ